MPIQLIGSEHSYYTGKVRAYLLQKQIPFEQIISTLDIYRKVIIPRAGWSVIPIILDQHAADADGEPICVQDTSLIIDYIESTYGQAQLAAGVDAAWLGVPRPLRQTLSIHPAGAIQRVVSFIFEVHGDLWLNMPGDLRLFLSHPFLPSSLAVP